MISIVSPNNTGLLAEMRAYFGLSQADMARLLGLLQVQVAQAETGVRLLPAHAIPRLQAIRAASQAPPTSLPPPDLQPLRHRLLQCQAQALRGQLRLTYDLPARAAAARARLGAAQALPATLATVEAEEPPLPPRTREDQQVQLTRLLNGARAEWDERSGPVPTALLRARLAGLRAEADVLADELAKIAVEYAA
ncbi:helix-turn-helix domain-containing protein [Hymenobacter negativus]|uniref:Helix-turn-helix transcriptional regulator n=1 Tax=Hymenobacter negativus TaxID=2795026 RepID=A0ABS3QDN2_9BACT|nr:helix-turn-helix domain-containing protein [Hymenobacter negativus]MBO2009357.1 helix-turn-helix transcriptional regulator [Hymenobacter negativus]